MGISAPKFISWEFVTEPIIHCGARRGGKRSILVCERPPLHAGFPGHACRSKGRWYFWRVKKWERPMARITDNLLVQLVEHEIGDDEIVVIDESTGQEVAFPKAVIDNVIAALNYFKDNS